VIPILGRIVLTLLWSAAVASVAVASDGAVPEFAATEMSSAEGYVRVEWSWSPEGPDDQFQLRLIEPDGERMAYEGPNHMVFLSGLPEGDYEMFVRHRAGDAPWGDWSAPATLAVRHHSMRMALTLFTAGGLMFLWIVVFLLRNVAATRRSTS
jgi:hypothetical protein